jgi:hypothetical protein
VVHECRRRGLPWPAEPWGSIRAHRRQAGKPHPTRSETEAPQLRSKVAATPNGHRRREQLSDERWAGGPMLGLDPPA